MNPESIMPSHINIIETLVRLYVLLMQQLDRCQYGPARAAYPEHQLQSQLRSTRAETITLLSVNRVVKHKVKEECDRVDAIAAECLMHGTRHIAAIENAQAERTVLKNKIMALSDVLAVFRAAVNEEGTRDEQLVGARRW
jgi:hypothetical protein